MSVFVPFRAFRPTKEKVSQVACKPYDVIDSDEAREESMGNDLSYYRVIRPEIEFPHSTDPYTEPVYNRGSENLNKLIADGILVQDDVDSYYIYQLKMGSHTQTGLVGCCSIDDYFNDVIRRHELTKPKVEEDRRKHIIVSGFNYEAVFFTYHAVDSINEIVGNSTREEPLYDFETSDRIRHTVWKISDPVTVEAIRKLFEDKVPVIYIADGHHRTAAGAMAGNQLRAESNGSGPHRYGYLMSVLFPDSQVRILDYNRVVRDLNGHSAAEFLDLLKEKFTIEELQGARHPEVHSRINMYLEGKWYCLSAREGSFDNTDLIGKLGFTILSENILEPILNITDLRHDDRIDFIGGIRGLEALEKLVDSGKMKVAFAMHPLDMAQLMEISDNGLIMPPKVTWFEPKLRSGLFAHRLSH